MASNKKQFIIDSERISFDAQHRRIIHYNMDKYYTSFDRGVKRFSDLPLARERVSFWKSEAINSLDERLLEFERNAQKNGIEVLWAENKEEALQYVSDIAKENDAHSMVKSKSMTTEEIDFNETFEAQGLDVLETDLGEYIVQTAGEKPYHIVTPAMHKSKEMIADLYHEKFGIPPNESPENITLFTRQQLRNRFRRADMGITGANFLLADAGAIALTENEGNAILSTSFRKIHIAIAGIEKVIPSYKQLGLFWHMLATYGTGQQTTVYSSIISGAKNRDSKMYVILLDNGRTHILKDKQREALKCIRCGACLNVCPVYKVVGGYTYNSVYSGPIGSVITPYYNGFKEFGHLSSACTLCRKCPETCPVKIPLDDFLLMNRHKAVKASSNVSWGISMKMFGIVFSNRALYDSLGAKLKNTFIKKMAQKVWGKKRDFPSFAQKSFFKQYQKQK